MAEPIPLDLPRRDPREALYRELEGAPREHAEALLSAYGVLQGLHDQGILEILRGALASKDKILEIVVDAAKSPEAIRAMRNLIILAKIAGTLDTDLLEGMARAVPESAAQAKGRPPPGLWTLFRKLTGPDSRRSLGAAAALLESSGKALAARPSVEGGPGCGATSDGAK